ncbi:Hypothetical predicted protein, partial [Pelobates cultripes]
MAEAPTTTGDEKTRIVQERLSLYGPNPSMEQQLMEEADEDIQKARAHELSLVTAHRNADAVSTSLRYAELTQQLWQLLYGARS